jgi:hypothetical protein
MRTQSDMKARVVSLDNLEAMCKWASGMTNEYYIESVSRSRVTVGYSNPSEYGSARPIFAVFAALPDLSTNPDKTNPRVVLEYLRVIETNDKSLMGEGWQSFEVLRDAPVMFRSPEDGKFHPFAPNPDYPTSTRAYVSLEDACRECGHNAYCHGSLSGGFDSPLESCHAFTGDIAPKCECKQFHSV